MNPMDKKQIILSYMRADIADAIPDRPAFIPGVGQTPSIRSHADDTFRIIATHWGKPGHERMVDGMVGQLSLLINHLV